jgi:predicted O-methyltransferase YrrM
VTAAPIHPLVEAALRDQVVVDGGGVALRLHSHVTPETCELLYAAAQVTGAKTAVETGMAYGIATLCLADAVRRNSATGRLFSIDPSQTTLWNGIALLQARRAGLSDTVQLLELPAHVALPQLLAAGERIDLAFIDGWHTFDHALVDFFYIDLLLRTGGIVILDDVAYPAINAIARFIAANRGYEVWRTLAPPDEKKPPVHGPKTAAKRLFRRLGRTDADPSPDHASMLETMRSAAVVAFRKLADDDRPYDHFQPF